MTQLLQLRRFIFLFAIGSMLLLNTCENGSPPKKIVIINPAQFLTPVVQGFKSQMSELGYIEDENIYYLGNKTIDYDQIQPLLEKFLHQQPDLILVMGTDATKIAKEATLDSHIPIVFAPVIDPVEIGLIDSLTQPGGHLTGVNAGPRETRRLQWLVQLAPQAQRIYLPFNATSPAVVSSVSNLRQIAEKLGVVLVTQEIYDAAEINTAIGNLPTDIDAIFLPSDIMIVSQINVWVKAANTRKLPLSSSSPVQVQAGALMAYGPDYGEVGKQAARIADKILRGANPAETPVELSEFFLAINLKTADFIDLAISDEDLHQAAIIIRE